MSKLPFDPATIDLSLTWILNRPINFWEPIDFFEADAEPLVFDPTGPSQAARPNRFVLNEGQAPRATLGVPIPGVAYRAGSDRITMDAEEFPFGSPNDSIPTPAWAADATFFTILERLWVLGATTSAPEVNVDEITLERWLSTGTGSTVSGQGVLIQDAQWVGSIESIAQGVALVSGVVTVEVIIDNPVLNRTTLRMDLQKVNATVTIAMNVPVESV